MIIKKIFPIFKQRSHRSKSGTTARDIQTAVAPLKSACSPLEGNDRSLRGFTLVELLVVMAMSAAMIAVTLVSMGDARSRKAVEGEARKFAATVREMQNYALTGRQMATGHVTCGVGIDRIRNHDESYAISYAWRSGTTCADSPTFTELAPSSLSNGVEFFVDVSNTTNAFYFKVPRGNLMNRSSVAITTAQLIVLQKGTASYSVCVYPSGMVTETAGTLGNCP